MGWKLEKTRNKSEVNAQSLARNYRYCIHIPFTYMLLTKISRHRAVKYSNIGRRKCIYFLVEKQWDDHKTLRQRWSTFVS